VEFESVMHLFSKDLHMSGLFTIAKNY